jgi:hypothetical protein
MLSLIHLYRYVLLKELGICALSPFPVFLRRNLPDDPEIQTGEGHALQDLQSAIAFTAQVTREYFGRHYPGDLDNCINHAIVARHILKITFAIEAVLVGGHAGWQYGPGAYDSVTCEDHSGTVYRCTAGDNFTGHAWVEVAGLIFDPTLHQLPGKIVLADRADHHRSRITYDFGMYLLLPRGSTTRVKFLRPHRIPKAGVFYYERTMSHTQVVRDCAAQSDVEEAIQLR